MRHVPNSRGKASLVPMDFVLLFSSSLLAACFTYLKHTLGLNLGPSGGILPFQP